MKKVLIITYYWTPSGGAGVQRWIKFSKYLPEYGWEPMILTVDQDFAAYPVTDLTLQGDISENLKVFRTKATDYFSFYKKNKSGIPTAGFANKSEDSLKGKMLRFIRGNFFIPDPRRGWNRFAFEKAVEIIQNEKPDCVITTSPPHSTQLIGLMLKKRFPEIKWIADLRDPWTDIYYYNLFYPTLISRYLDSCYEKRVLQRADKIITVGESLRSHYADKIKEVSAKSSVITNGFDEEDFKSQISEKPQLFTISYIGTLSESYPLDGFLKALSAIKAEGFSFGLRFAGMVAPLQKKKIKDLFSENNVEFIDYVSHNEAINQLMRSSALLLIIPDHQSNRSIITGKLFEYLGSGKPIIALGPKDGDAASIIGKAKAGCTFGYNDTIEILLYIKNLLKNEVRITDTDRSIYSRASLTKQLAEFLNN